MAPPEVLPEARQGLQLRHLVTPAYAALASMVFDAETPASVLERARADLATRSYVPDGEDRAGWAGEARDCLAELAARRKRWDTMAEARVEKRQLRGSRRRYRTGE
jgi:hypothetical protein